MNNNIATAKAIVTIYPAEIVPGTIYLHDQHGRHDLLGQIIRGMGVTIEPKTRLPSQMGIALSPFTYKVRLTVVDTVLSLTLLSFAHSPAMQQVKRAQDLLTEHNIYLRIEK